jgi:hypothetical protein
MFELMFDLKGKNQNFLISISLSFLGMGENNCSWNRRLTLQRETLLAAQAIYQSKFNLVFMILIIYNYSFIA